MMIAFSGLLLPRERSAIAYGFHSLPPRRKAMKANALPRAEQNDMTPEPCHA
jgi:hypothetical protein